MKESLKLTVTVAVVAVFILGGLVVLYFQAAHLGWGPFGGDESISAQRLAYNGKLNAALQKIDQIEGKKEEKRKLTAVAKTASQLLPRQQNPDELLRAIRKKAQESGVRPLSVEPRQVRGSSVEGDYEELNFRVEISGKYDQIGAFVNRMEEFEIRGKDGPEKRFFAIKEITIRADANGVNEHGILNCALIMQTFKYTGEEPEEG